MVDKSRYALKIHGYYKEITLRNVIYPQINGELLLKQDSVGSQLSPDELYQRQQTQQPSCPAPMVIAIGLHTPENIGSVFRIADAVACEKVLLIDSKPQNMKKITRISRHTTKSVPHQF